MIGAAMLDNLKIALRRERRLITIFVLTILAPSVALGVFGIRAIKTERFRLAKQLEDEHRRAAESIKRQVSAGVGELEATLRSLVAEAAVKNQDYAGVSVLARKLGNLPLVESFFVAYGTEDPFFPLFQPAAPPVDRAVPAVPSLALRQKLQDAQRTEFANKNPARAAVLYAGLAGQTKDDDLRAQMIGDEARCLMKLGRYEPALRRYERIESEHPDAVGESGAPLALLAGLQAAACCRELGDPAKAGEKALSMLGDILEMRWSLDEGRFRAYVSLASDAIEGILAGEDKPASGKLADYRTRYEGLKRLLREKDQQWGTLRAIRQDIVPDLRKRQNGASGAGTPLRFSRTLRGRTFLIVAVPVPDPERPSESGIAGVSIKQEALLAGIPSRVETDADSDGGPRVVISDLEGNALLGDEGDAVKSEAVTEFFDENFPPWKIEVFRGPAEGTRIPFQKSFYFWTIITLVIILTFGAVLIVRTIGHEMDVLRLKSDFVASVSHEFKTPLTSMRALLERLREGKVSDPGRMSEYFSQISRNTDQLNRLVKNLLDFSKIEEGKREFRFVPTDLAEFVTAQVAEFKRNELGPGIEVRLRTDPDVPPVSVDRDAVSQAVTNLLDNAVKFSSGDRAVEVHVGRSGDRVFIEVADKGIGIPQDELGRVFEKFYQGGNAAKLSARGTGLGLTLVKHTVEAHGGEVSVKSRVGEGSTFRLAFPIAAK